MKNKTLKHYKRKKFFYRFFMRKSPRSGAMFGLAWMICFGAILPLAPFLFLKMVPQAKYDFNTADIILLLTAAVLFFTVCLLIYAYGFLTFVKNFYTILRNDLKKSRWWKLPALGGALLWELAGMFMLPIVLEKRRWLALIFLMGSFIFVFVVFMFDTRLEKWWCFHFGQSLMLLLALAASGKDKKFSWRFVYPLLLFAYFVIKL